jgi:IS5 family transposase
MHGKSAGSSKKLAATPKYVSPTQLRLAGFETPFDQQLSPDNRWVRLAHSIPWDPIVSIYDKQFHSLEGRPPLSGRIIIGALIIKHIESFTDRATIAHITENMYMQYFLGYTSFSRDAPFTAPLFVAIRKRLSLELVSKISELVARHGMQSAYDPDADSDGSDVDEPPDAPSTPKDANTETTIAPPSPPAPAPKGRLLMDATVAPQNITFPTDLKLLDAARRKSEELIDALYDSKRHGKDKPRTYRKQARRDFLNTAKKKQKWAKVIYKANGQQLNYLRRNIGHIDALLKAYKDAPLNEGQTKYLQTIRTVYEQQFGMHSSRTHRVDDRIVSLHQPHVRPIVRGKERSKVEFGSKLQVSLVDGYMFIDKLSWDAFNEGTCLKDSVARYRRRFGHYPAEVLADQIYCNRENRAWLKALGIQLKAKPLGRPSAKAVENHVSPGERNPVEGKFGQGKLGYGLDCIKAKLKKTSESWIACIALVLNLVRLAGKAPLSLYQLFYIWLEKQIYGVMDKIVGKIC